MITLGEPAEAVNGTEQTAQESQPAQLPVVVPQEESFLNSVGSWIASYWMWLAGGVAAAGLGYAAYRVLNSSDEERVE